MHKINKKASGLRYSFLQFQHRNVLCVYVSGLTSNIYWGNERMFIIKSSKSLDVGRNSYSYNGP